MANMTDHVQRFRLQWSGFNGGPGLSTFYTSTDTAVVTNANGYFRTFFEAIKGSLAPGVTITYPTSIDELDSVTGFIVTSSAVTAPAATVSTGTGVYPGGCGAQIRWHTSGNTTAIKPPHGVHVVVGATFIAPLAGGTYDSDGTIQSAFVSSLSTAGNAMVTSFANNLRILTKPVVDDSGAVLRAGHNSPVVSVSVKDRDAMLKSRRG